jgi:hypothetical protein
MLVDVVETRALDLYRLWIRFDDGAEGSVDVAALVPFRGVFEPLRDPAEFARAYVDPELGTVRWPCGADLEPPSTVFARDGLRNQPRWLLAGTRLTPLPYTDLGAI